MNKKSIQENEFFGAPGGQAGTISYGTGYGTPSSPDISQDPGHFGNNLNMKGVDHMNHEETGSIEKQASIDPQSSFDKNVDQIFQKKDTPSPDEIMSALQYELGQMIKKDKRVAKDIVLQNLKTDPHYYSRLNMLNIDDDKMKVTELKKVLDQMFEDHQARRRSRWGEPNDELAKTMREMAEEKRRRRYDRGE